MQFNVTPLAQLENTQKQAYSMDIETLLKSLDSKRTGLTQQEASKRLAKFGSNVLRKEHGKSPLRLFLLQFKNILVIILLIATALSIVVGEVYDAVVIIAIVVAVAVLGFTQEYRAEKAIEALKKMTASTALVLRGGKEVRIRTQEIVPGDILLLSTGDKIPADARLIEAMNLKTDEAPLTGESVPVGKNTDELAEGVPISERANMVFTGTIVAYGRGKAIVTSTGMDTEFGNIARMVQEAKEERTPLEVRMAFVGKWLGILSVSICAAIIVLGVVRQHPILEMVLWGISLAVAAVPEALPAVVTGALALGMYRMARQQAIVRKLPAVETLGCTSVICSDKTGTMTKGEMTVQNVYTNQKLIRVTGIGYEPKGEFLFEEKPLDALREVEILKLLKIAALCNDAKIEERESKWTVNGDSTEGALLVAAAKAGLSKEDIEKEEPRIEEIPFSSERKRMTTVHQNLVNERIAYMKGAPEVVLQHCSMILVNGKARKLNKEDQSDISRIVDEMSTQALRNLGFAFRELPGTLRSFNEENEESFVFAGIMGMIDPPREEVKGCNQLVQECRDQGSDDHWRPQTHRSCGSQSLELNKRKRK